MAGVGGVFPPAPVSVFRAPPYNADLNSFGRGCKNSFL